VIKDLIERSLDHHPHIVAMWRLAPATSSIGVVRGCASCHGAAPSKLWTRTNALELKSRSLLLCRAFSSPNARANLQCVHVFVSVKPGREEDFLSASLANARASSREEGIARFDVIQQEDDPTKFVLVEVYKNDGAPAAHKETDHYLAWRAAVEDMMAEPRKAIKYKNIFPATVAGWDYVDGVIVD
jgi:autoinducer 2-degrading protein